MRENKDTIEKILRENNDRLCAIPGVVGTAVGLHEGRPCILVTVTKKDAEIIAKITSILGTSPVAIVAVGEPELFDGQ